MLKGLEDALITFLQSFYGNVGWLGVIVMMAIESLMIPLPSEIIMPLAGWLLVANKGDGWGQILLAGVFGALGCLIGSAIAYGIGRAGGRPLVLKYGKYVLINPEHLESAENWLSRWGGWAAFISRMLPVVRTFISLPMGVVRSPFIPFALLTFTGSFIWCTALAWLGFVLGPKYQQVRNSTSWLDYVFIVLIIGLIGWFVYHRLRQRKQPTSTE